MRRFDGRKLTLSREAIKLESGDFLAAWLRAEMHGEFA